MAAPSVLIGDRTVPDALLDPLGATTIAFAGTG
jgi:hypothetical protein